MDKPAPKGLVVVAGTALTGIALGAVMGVLWWWVTPTERWVKLDGGLGAAELNTSSWFAADAWFLILGVVAGIGLAVISWRWARRAPVAMVLGIVVGSVLLAAVAWSLGGILGPPDPTVTAKSVAVGTTIEGSLGLRAVGVLGAPAVSALALVSLLLAMSKVADEPPLQGPDDVASLAAS
jgi:hypothetical protein